MLSYVHHDRYQLAFMPSKNLSTRASKAYEHTEHVQSLNTKYKQVQQETLQTTATALVRKE